MTLLIVLSVVLRFVLKAPLGIYDEIARILMVWLSFLGIAVAIDRRRHLNLDLLGNRVSPQVRVVLNQIGALAFVVFGCLLVYGGWQVTASSANQYFTMSGLSNAVQYAAAPVGGFFMVVYGLKWFFEERAGRRAADESPTHLEFE